MATSSAFNTSNKYIKYKITVTEGTPDVENNTSPVTVSVNFYRTNTGYETWGTGRVYCKINGTQHYQTVDSSQKITNSGIVLFKMTVAGIQHDDDGGKTLRVSAWIDHEEVTSSEQGFNVELNVIPRASQPSCITWPEHTQNVGYFGDTISIHMNRKSSSFTHMVFYHWGGSGPVIAENVENGVEWTIPLSLMNTIPNATEGSGIIYANTYNGTQEIGQKYCGFTVKVPASVKPTCSIQVLDATGTKDKYGSLVKGLSKLYIKTTAAGAYSSTIKQYVVNANGAHYSKAEVTTGVLSTAGTTTVTAQVLDSRGRTSSVATASFPVLDYVNPAITALSVHRCDADGNEDDQGEFVQVVFSATVTPLNNKNSATYKLKYSKSTDSVETITLTDLAGEYAVSDYSYIFPADSDYSYEVAVEVKDDIHTTTRTTSASTAFSLMDLHASGTGLRFGGVAERENTMEVSLPLLANGGIVPIEIAEDTDLNEIKLSGLYRCALSGTAESLINSPTDKAFVMEVLPNVPTTQRITEYIEHSSPRVFIRNYYDYKDTWGQWYELVPLQNRITEKVSLIQLDVATIYTFPSDGYLVLKAHYSAGSYVNCAVSGADGGVAFTLTASSVTTGTLKGNPTDALFVRKGMKLGIVSTSSTTQNSLDFYPVY